MEDDLLLSFELACELVEPSRGRVLRRRSQHAHDVATLEVVVSDVDHLDWGRRRGRFRGLLEDGGQILKRKMRRDGRRVSSEATAREGRQAD